jgi:hypothetical protein
VNRSCPIVEFIILRKKSFVNVNEDIICLTKNNITQNQKSSPFLGWIAIIDEESIVNLITVLLGSSQ